MSLKFSMRVRRRLLVAMQRKASKIGLSISPGCTQMIEQMINTGLQRMQVQGALEREPQIKLAEDNMQRLVKELYDEAVERGTFPTVDDTALNLVVQRTCPIWPYC